MKKIEAIIRPEKFEDASAALAIHDINGLTISQVMGCGNQIGKRNFYRSTVVEQALLPKIKIEIVIEDKNIDEIIGAILKTAKTGKLVTERFLFMI